MTFSVDKPSGLIYSLISVKRAQPIRKKGLARYTDGSTPTQRRYTGQLEAEAGLYYYKARWYDPTLARWIQPDTLIPLGQGVQAFDRYAYAKNNPVRYKDPTGHWIESVFDIASIAYDVYDISKNGLNWGTGLALAADVGSLILPEVAGGGVAVRALTHADEVVDVAKAVDVTGDVIQTANQAENAIQAANKLGNLANAAEYGIKPYKELRLATKGTGLEAHLLIEKRFADILELDPNSIPSVAVTKAEHQVFTNAWRELIGYSTDKNKRVTTTNATIDDIWAAAQKVYADYPDLLEEVRKFLGK